MRNSYEQDYINNQNAGLLQKDEDDQNDGQIKSINYIRPRPFPHENNREYKLDVVCHENECRILSKSCCSPCENFLIASGRCKQNCFYVIIWHFNDARIRKVLRYQYSFPNESDMQQKQNSILNKEFDSMEAMEKVVGWDEEDRIARGVQTQVIRRIPGYKFFEPFKHGWRKCKSHDKNMTVKHIMMEHLMNEPANWLKKLERIQEYILDTAKPFSSKIQKAMSELATKLAKRIKDLIASDCEPYVKKKNNPVQ